MRWTQYGALIFLLCSCGSRGDLSERHARTTAEALVAVNGPRIRDFHQLKWKSLKRVSPTEANGLADMIYRFRLPSGEMGEEHIPGKFVYRKRASGDWVLSHVDFPNPNNLYHQLDQDVMVKVTSAKVARSDLENQIPAGSASRGETGDPSEHSPSDSGDSTRSASRLSFEAARRAAEDCVSSIERSGETWSTRDFGAVRVISDSDAKLPATLVVQRVDSEREYKGAFVFTYRPDTREWMLSKLSFHSDGAAPIEEEVGVAVLE